MFHIQALGGVADQSEDVCTAAALLLTGVVVDLLSLLSVQPPTM